jgi:hypothetical protein
MAAHGSMIRAFQTAEIAETPELKEKIDLSEAAGAVRQRGAR